MNIKELLKEKREIVIKLNNDNRKAFLRQAKKENFCWASGCEISENDNCAFHILATCDMKIFNVSTMCYLNSPELKDVSMYEM